MGPDYVGPYKQWGKYAILKLHIIDSSPRRTHANVLLARPSYRANPVLHRSNQAVHRRPVHWCICTGIALSVIRPEAGPNFGEISNLQIELIANGCAFFLFGPRKNCSALQTRPHSRTAAYCSPLLT